MISPKRPTKAELLATADATVRDVIAPGLRVLFCGVNPGLYSAYTGLHFSRPGNRFWHALYAAGFTGELLSPDRQDELLEVGCGVTNLVSRALSSARDIQQDELEEGAQRLADSIELLRPRAVAILGVTAYRRAYNATDSQIGRQMPGIGPAPLWVLPSPSGVNAHYPPAKLASVYSGFREELEELDIWA